MKMKHSSRIWFIVSLLLILSLVLSACAGAQPAPEEAEPELVGDFRLLDSEEGDAVDVAGTTGVLEFTPVPPECAPEVIQDAEMPACLAEVEPLFNGTEIDAARGLMMRAIWAAGQPGRHSRESAAAKLFASEMCNRVVGQAIQIHGGYGFSSEYPVERLFRDARVVTIYEGTSEILQSIIGTHRWRQTVKTKGGFYRDLARITGGRVTTIDD